MFLFLDMPFSTYPKRRMWARYPSIWRNTNATNHYRPSWKISFLNDCLWRCRAFQNVTLRILSRYFCYTFSKRERNFPYLLGSNLSRNASVLQLRVPWIPTMSTVGSMRGKNRVENSEPENFLKKPEAWHSFEDWCLLHEKLMCKCSFFIFVLSY